MPRVRVREVGRKTGLACACAKRAAIGLARARSGARVRRREHGHGERYAATRGIKGTKLLYSMCLPTPARSQIRYKRGVFPRRHGMKKPRLMRAGLCRGDGGAHSKTAGLAA
jgi:hypothetical protein